MEAVKVTTETPLGPERIADLFNEAVHLASTAPAPAPGEGVGLESHTSAVEHIWKAQMALKSDILGRVQDVIRVAAAKGHTTAELLTFHGNDKFKTSETCEEFPVLFLLKGPANQEQRHKLLAEGFVPLIEVLQKELAPFEVRHNWTVGTNANRIHLVWPRHNNTM